MRQICWYCQLACGAVLVLEISEIDKIPFSSTSACACGSSGSISAVLRRSGGLGPFQPAGGLGRPPSRHYAAGARSVAWPPLGYARAVWVAGTCACGRGRGSARQYPWRRSHAPRMVPGPGPVCGCCVPRPAPSAHREFYAYAGDLICTELSLSHTCTGSALNRLGFLANRIYNASVTFQAIWRVEGRV